MSSEVVDELGATCPDEGSFYVCYDKPTRFVGCCAVDPCKTDDGNCPDDELRTTSFDKFSYNQIEPQMCVSDRPEVQWWTCGAIEVPFMGCCSENPCNANSCPPDSLFAARLNDDEELAKAFMPEGAGSNSEGGLSTAAIVGIGVGSAAGALAIAGLLFWFWRKRRASRVIDTNKGYMAPGDGAPSLFDYHVSAKIQSPSTVLSAAASPNPQYPPSSSPYSSRSPNPQSPPYDPHSSFHQDHYYNQQWGQLQSQSPAQHGYQVSSYPSTATLRTPGVGTYRDSVQSAHFGPAELPVTSEISKDSPGKPNPLFSPSGQGGEYIQLEGRAEHHRSQPSELDG